MSITPATAKRINQRLLAFAALGLVVAIAMAPKEQAGFSRDGTLAQSGNDLRRVDSSRSLAAR